MDKVNTDTEQASVMAETAAVSTHTHTRTHTHAHTHIHTHTHMHTHTHTHRMVHDVNRLKDSLMQSKVHNSLCKNRFLKAHACERICYCRRYSTDITTHIHIYCVSTHSIYTVVNHGSDIISYFFHVGCIYRTDTTKYSNNYFLFSHTV